MTDYTAATEAPRHGTQSINAVAWQESWDRQQEAFMPDREQRFAAMLDAVAATTVGRPPRLLDLAGGTGTISLRTLARFAGADVTVLDQDPVLLAIADTSLRDRVTTADTDLGDRGTIVDADLGDPGWRAKLPREGFDAVLTATALHWLPAERVAALYGEVREVLRPGGIFVNADHMPEEGLPTLSVKLRDQARGVREARYATGAATSWPDWWELAAADEFLAPKAIERERIYPSARHNHEWTPPVAWHVEALRAAGYTEAGVLWRGGTDAAVVGTR
ncbi:MAG TPA: class I SAM-dependent methyltransferase [Actinoplanes sp.]